MLRLGGTFLAVDAKSSSVKKGETLEVCTTCDMHALLTDAFCFSCLGLMGVMCAMPTFDASSFPSSRLVKTFCESNFNALPASAVMNQTFSCNYYTGEASPLQSAVRMI